MHSACNGVAIAARVPPKVKTIKIDSLSKDEGIIKQIKTR